MKSHQLGTAKAEAMTMAEMVARPAMINPTRLMKHIRLGSREVVPLPLRIAIDKPRMNVMRRAQLFGEQKGAITDAVNGRWQSRHNLEDFQRHRKRNPNFVSVDGDY